MPQLQQLWDQYKDKGLHVFHAESQGASKDDLEKWLAKRNVTFPNIQGRGPFGGYQGEQGLPYAFVIGTDGKVIWQGRSGYKTVIHEEIKKVRYPGLGKPSVAKGLEKSAHNFGMKKFAKAITDAKKKMEKDADNTALVADANYIIERATKAGEKMKARFERLQKNREYSQAMLALQQMQVSFKGMPQGDNAKATLKKLKSDPAVKKEMKAEAALEGIKKKLGTMHDPDKKRALLESFASKYEGLKAAERARQLINWL